MFEKTTVPAAVKSSFAEWCTPRRGLSNPENQTNAVWAWLFENEHWPDKAHKIAGSGKKQEPGWCFSRFGQTETSINGGQTVFIGGEHEDFYDPDFYIYNDVTVIKEDGSIEFYGYTVADFPPTDFHSATLVNDKIVIIGGLGYAEDRKEGVTPVHILSLDNFSIKRLETSDNQPSWLHGHSASLDSTGETIMCVGGKVSHIVTGQTVENIAQWRICLKTGEWSSADQIDTRRPIR